MDERKASLSLPVILAALSVWVLYMAAQLPEFIQRGQRLPGPRYFPTILSVFLLIAAGVELARYLRYRRSVSGEYGGALDRVRERLSMLRSSWGARSVGVILGTSVALVPVTQLIGFPLAGTAYGVLLMMRLKARWYSAVVVSVVVVIVITVVFGRLFRVPLPLGVIRYLL